MTIYSIEKVGSDYVVKVDDQSVIKVGSRRRAAQLVVDASELLDEITLVPDGRSSSLERAIAADAASQAGQDPEAEDVAPPSITRDMSKVA